MTKSIQKYKDKLMSTIDAIDPFQIENVVDIMHQARLAQQNIFVMGNGGSASTASHMACDLAKNTRFNELADFRILELVDSTASLTAYGNDEGYENIFLPRLASFLNQDDIVIGISASGNSKNVLNAVEYAKEAGAITISLVGFDGGALRQLTHYSIYAPSNCIEVVEDCHLAINHILTTELRDLASIHAKNI